MKKIAFAMLALCLAAGCGDRVVQVPIDNSVAAPCDSTTSNEAAACPETPATKPVPPRGNPHPQPYPSRDDK